MKQQAIDAVHDLLALDARDLYSSELKLRDEAASRSAFYKGLQALRIRNAALDKKFADLRDKYGAYPEVVGSGSASIVFPLLLQRTDELLQHTGQLIKESPSGEKMSQLRDDLFFTNWTNAVNSFSNWMSDRRSDLGEARRKTSAGAPTTGYDRERRNLARSAFERLMAETQNTQRRAATFWSRWNAAPDSVTMSEFSAELEAIDEGLTTYETRAETEWVRYEGSVETVGRSSSDWTSKPNQFRATTRSARHSVDEARKQAPDDRGSRLRYKDFVEGWKDADDDYGKWITSRIQFLHAERE